MSTNVSLLGKPGSRTHPLMIPWEWFSLISSQWLFVFQIVTSELVNQFFFRETSQGARIFRYPPFYLPLSIFLLKAFLSVSFFITSAKKLYSIWSNNTSVFLFVEGIIYFHDNVCHLSKQLFFSCSKFKGRISYQWVMKKKKLLCSW